MTQRVTAHLQAKGLGGYLHGTIVRPTAPIEKEPQHVFEARQFEFDTRQEQTIGILKTYTPKQVIEALSKQFQPTGSARFLTAIGRLFTLRKRSDQAISSYFADINELVTTAFPDITEDIPAEASPAERSVARAALLRLFDKWVLAVTLNGLTSDYDTVKAIIQDWTDINLERARDRI